MYLLRWSKGQLSPNKLFLEMIVYVLCLFCMRFSAWIKKRHNMLYSLFLLYFKQFCQIWHQMYFIFQAKSILSCKYTWCKSLQECSTEFWTFPAEKCKHPIIVVALKSDITSFVLLIVTFVHSGMSGVIYKWTSGQFEKQIKPNIKSKSCKFKVSVGFSRRRILFLSLKFCLCRHTLFR